MVEADDVRPGPEGLAVVGAVGFSPLSELDLSMIHDGIELLDPTEDHEGPENAWARRVRLLDVFKGRVEAPRQDLPLARPSLLDLAEQYLSDCETRISILQDERYELRGMIDGQDVGGLLKDLDEQIAHWETTKKQVEQTIQACRGVTNGQHGK